MAAALLAAATACKHTEEPIETTTMSASQASDDATASAATESATEPATTSPTNVGPVTTSTDDPETTNVGPVTSGTTEDTSTGTPTTGDTAGAENPCCIEQDTPGCPADPAIEACVCAEDELCCDPNLTWDVFCVMAIAEYMCGVCVDGNTTSG
jgi:hypothetical protein